MATLLFDWDGTIADSAQLGLNAFQKPFGALGLEFPQEIYEAAYSPNWYSIYEAMGLPKEKWATADDLWMQHYGEQTAQLVDVLSSDRTHLGKCVTEGSLIRFPHLLLRLELGGTASSKDVRSLMC